MPEALHFQLDEYYLDLQKQGQEVGLMDREETLRNPFPGLRPFRTGEAHLFFGREGQAEALIGRLMQTHFLGVLGNSGSGKSSLARAGLIPALHVGKKQNRVSDWKIVICRPGNCPVQNLAAALAGANKNTTEQAVLVPEVQRLLPLLQESSFGLLEAEADAGEHDKTLLIVDQFEELFRFENEIPAGEAAHFVDLLLTAVQQENAHIYVVITMRSEFLGECVRYRGLPEIINEGQYLVPRLTGENVRRAVTGPLGVVGAPVDATLVNRLVREVGDNMDQLPLLQHALMRTYRHWQQRGAADAPITHADYEAVGGMGEALGRHADEHFRQLDPTGQAVAKLLFQRLTDLSAGDKGGRRPTIMAEIYGLAQALPADRAAVNRVIDQFRQLDTSFLMPPPGAPMEEESMLDISHESLIRNWAQLNNWAKEEAENARLYQRLQQARAEHDEDPSQGWITGALLQRLDEWHTRTPINHFWAARYHPEPARAHDWPAEQERYNRNMAFLDECQKAETDRAVARDAEIAEKARGKQRERYRNVIIVVVSVAALVAVGLALWAIQEKEIANKAQKETAAALKKVEQEKAATEAQRSIAETKTREAESNLQLADENLKKAQAEEARARAALAQVEKEKAATEEQRQAAQRNYELAQEKTQEAEKNAEEARAALEKQQAALEDVVRLTLAEVDRLIYELDYAAAQEKIRTIQNLGVSKQTVSDALLELAFWYAETGIKEPVWGILDTAYLLADRAPADRSIGPRAAIRALNAAKDSFLQQRYYPVMVDIPGGTFNMGSET